MARFKAKLVTPNQYYDAIAHVYDNSLSLKKDLLVRADVEQLFKERITKGIVMDFGGGTGLDLPWLAKSGYAIYFCEPSKNMRDVAKSKYADAGINFIEDSRVSFENWENDEGWNGMFDAILANFGVINYVPNLPSLFRSLEYVTRPGASLFLSLLSPSRKLSAGRFLKSLRSWITGQPLKTGSKYSDVAHEATLYSINQVNTAAKLYFDLQEVKRLGDRSDFTLLHFMKRSSSR